MFEDHLSCPAGVRTVTSIENFKVGPFPGAASVLDRDLTELQQGAEMLTTLQKPCFGWMLCKLVENDATGFSTFFLSFSADALTSVLTKINRIDIVTLLEGPIFDYGNISGTRSFADENNVFHDPVDGNCI